MTVCFADPMIWPRLRVDKGAIRFVFSGANIMCPGLTSPGATIEDEANENQVVVRAFQMVLHCVCLITNRSLCIRKVIMAEGKEHALAVGICKMSTAEM